MLAVALAFQQDLLSAMGQTIGWMIVFFIASPAASAAYLTVSETFPIEIRAMTIAIFYAIGTGVGGVAAPLIFGRLIESGSRQAIFGGYVFAACLMFAAAVVAWLLRHQRRAQVARRGRGAAVCGGVRPGELAHPEPMEIAVPPAATAVIYALVRYRRTGGIRRRKSVGWAPSWRLGSAWPARGSSPLCGASAVVPFDRRDGRLGVLRTRMRILYWRFASAVGPRSACRLAGGALLAAGLRPQCGGPHAALKVRR